MYHVSEASICWVSVQFLWSVPAQDYDTLFVCFLYLKNENVVYNVSAHKWNYFAASNYVYSYLYEEKIQRILPYYLIKEKMQMISLAPPCNSKPLQCPILAQTILYLSHIYLNFFNKCAIYFVKCRFLNWALYITDVSLHFLQPGVYISLLLWKGFYICKRRNLYFKNKQVSPVQI